MENAPQRLNKSKAWGCLTSNVTFPGLGSLVAGRRCGYAQVVVCVIGQSLSVLWLILWLKQWISTGQIPLALDTTLLMGVIGVVIFGIAWLWALATSLSILREAKRLPPKT